MQIGRFEDGKIVERWGSSDELGILQQLGVDPKPRERASQSSGLDRDARQARCDAESDRCGRPRAVPREWPGPRR